jgi:hypothetical protein
MADQRSEDLLRGSPDGSGEIDGKVPECPICKTHGWRRWLPDDLQEAEVFQEVVMAQRIKGGDANLVGLRVLSFVCTYCGFVRQHVPRGTPTP